MSNRLAGNLLGISCLFLIAAMSLMVPAVFIGITIWRWVDPGVEKRLAVWLVAGTVLGATALSLILTAALICAFGKARS